MRSRTTIIGTIVIAGLLAVTVYALYRHPAQMSAREASRPALKAGTPLPATSATQQGQASRPPSPPNTGIPLTTPRPEPARTLTAAASEQLRAAEQALPPGARVATYPAGETQLKAALVVADLDGDGKAEVVVVHSDRPATDKEPLPQLALSVLTREGDLMKVHSATSLADGGVLFNIDFDGTANPIAVQDVTGDGRPEILVASGMGASLGGA